MESKPWDRVWTTHGRSAPGDNRTLGSRCDCRLAGRLPLFYYPTILSNRRCEAPIPDSQPPPHPQELPLGTVQAEHEGQIVELPDERGVRSVQAGELRAETLNNGRWMVTRAEQTCLTLPSTPPRRLECQGPGGAARYDKCTPL